MFSLESPHRGDSNEYTQYTIFHIKRNSPFIILNLQLCDFFSRGLKNEFEIAVVNEPSVFEPLKFYCIFLVKRIRCLAILAILNILNFCCFSLKSFLQLRELKMLHLKFGIQGFYYNNTTLILRLYISQGFHLSGL